MILINQIIEKILIIEKIQCLVEVIRGLSEDQISKIIEELEKDKDIIKTKIEFNKIIDYLSLLCGKKSLSQEQRNKIYTVINNMMLPDDRYPYEVISEDYNGDEGKYLRIMARYHEVSLI
jgi:hypothetical protein